MQDFQAAVRDYQAHAESLRLLRIAGESLSQGAKAQDYDLYARAIYALEESLTLWPGNARAKELLTNGAGGIRPAGARQGRLRSGRLAARPGDRNASASAGQARQRTPRAESRQRRIKFLKGAVAALVGVGRRHRAASLTVAVSQERDEAVVATRSRRDGAGRSGQTRRKSATKGWAEAEKNLEAEARGGEPPRWSSARSPT